MEAETVTRYEVLTPTGFCVSVPRDIWKAWPQGHRRRVCVTPEENQRLDREQAAYDAEALHA